jgi:hypothetical protein
MTHSETGERAKLIAGFRDFADYLESHPDVPAIGRATIYAFPPDSSCDGMRGEIDAIAAQLDVEAHESANGTHYTALRSFGPVEYRAVAICEYHHDTCEGEF